MEFLQGVQEFLGMMGYGAGMLIMPIVAFLMLLMGYRVVL
jgi:hypothetical protein